MIEKTLKKTTIKNYKEEFKLSKKVKKIIVSNSILRILYDAIIQIGVFFLTLATMYFSKNVILAIAFLALHFMREPVFTIINTKLSQNKAFFKLISKEFLSEIKGKIIAKTRNKVEIEKDDKVHIMSDAVILATVEDYIINKYEVLLSVSFFCCDLTIFIFSIICLLNIASSQIVNMSLFILILVCSCILMIGVSIFIFYARKRYWIEAKPKYDNLRDSERDIQEIETISKKHINNLLRNNVKAQSDVTNVEIHDRNIKDIGEVIKTIVIFLSIISVVFFMMFISDNLTAEVFMTAITFGTAFSSVISSITGQVNAFFEIIEAKKKNKEINEQHFVKIMQVYFDEKKIKEEKFNEDCLSISPFVYEYPTTGFKITLDKTLLLKRGKVYLLKGNSGVGKSTFVKIISGENKLSDIKWKLNSIKYFNDTSRFGSSNLLDEITLGDYTDSDFDKLMEILAGTKLLSKFPTIESLKNTFAKSLSNGLTQRALLARVLYNLEDSDLVCIDEPIGSLDENNAKDVIEFAKEYCNRDKKRFVLLCTHQYKFIGDFIDGEIEISPISTLESQIIV